MLARIVERGKTGAGRAAGGARGALAAPALVVALALVAAPAWGVAVTVTVTGDAGQAIAGAEIDLGLGIEKARTDDRGEAVLEVPDELMGRTIDAWIAYVDEATGEERRIRRTVTLGRTILIRLPPPTKTPAKKFGCHVTGGSHQIGLGVERVELDETKLEAQSFEAVGKINGTEVARDSGTRSPEELAEINRAERKDHRLDSLPELFVRIALLGRPCDNGASFVPALLFGVSRLDATFESREVNGTSGSTQLEGDGMLFRAGVDFSVRKKESRTIFGFGAVHMRSDDIELDRRGGLARFFPPGSIELRDDIEYKYRATGGRATVGRAFDNAVPYVGVQHTRWKADLTFDAEVDVTSSFPTAPPGTMVTIEQRVRNRFDGDDTQGIVGVILRLAGAVAVQAEGRFGSDGFAAALNAALVMRERDRERASPRAAGTSWR
jgi:hypothetical protein